MSARDILKVVSAGASWQLPPSTPKGPPGGPLLGNAPCYADPCHAVSRRPLPMSAHQGPARVWRIDSGSFGNAHRHGSSTRSY